MVWFQNVGFPHESAIVMLTFIAAVVAAVAGSSAAFILQRHSMRDDKRADAAEEHARTVELVLRELVKAVRMPGTVMQLPPGW